MDSELWLDTLKGSNNLADLCMDQRMILKLIIMERNLSEDSIHLAHDRGRWQNSVNTVINY